MDNYVAAFVATNKMGINQFLNCFCEVTNFYETLEMDSYVTPSIATNKMRINKFLNDLREVRGFYESLRTQGAYEGTPPRISLTGSGLAERSP